MPNNGFNKTTKTDIAKNLGNYMRKIINLFKNIFIFTAVMVIVVLNIKTYMYKKDNAKLFDVRYAKRPSKEYMHELFDKITEGRQSYKNDFFINKGAFSVMTIRKKYDNLDYMPIFIHNMKALDFVEIEHNQRYCLEQMEAVLSMESDNHGEKYFSFGLSWEQDSVCRRIDVAKRD